MQNLKQQIKTAAKTALIFGVLGTSFFVNSACDPNGGNGPEADRNGYYKVCDPLGAAVTTCVEGGNACPATMVRCAL